MVFGWGCSAAPSRSQLPSGAAEADDAIGSNPGGVLASLATSAADDVSWAPLPSGAAAARKPKQPPPFKLKSHDVKARLQDRSTALVELVSVVDAPGDVMFDLLADPHQHEHIFDAIESASAELVSEEGAVRKWRLDYRARWSFWKVGGVCDSRLWMTTDRERGTVTFALREPGFLRKYEGTWTITGPDGRGPGAVAAAATPGGVSGDVHTAATVPDGSRRHRLSIDSGAAPPSPSAASHSAASDDGAVSRSCDLSLSSRSSSSSCSMGLLSEAPQSPAARSSSDSNGSNGLPGRGGGSSESGGGVAALFASITNPFFAAPPSPSPTLARAPVSSRGASGSDIAASPLPQLPPAGPPRIFTTKIQVRKEISPKISPPYPINQVLKGHASGQVNDMLEGLLAATARRFEQLGREQVHQEQQV